ncbi:hypothetical protein pb186bvf_013299 [Paramecium bursaria]
MLILLLILVQAHNYGRYHTDFDNMATDEAGQKLIKTVRAELRQTHDQAEFMIYLNKLESQTALVSLDEYHEQSIEDLTNIEITKQKVQDAKFRISNYEFKVRKINEQQEKLEQIILEKTDVIEETEKTMADLENMRAEEESLYNQRRTEITLASQILRKTKYLIGLLIPRDIPNLQKQTKFAKTNDEKELDLADIEREFIQIKSDLCSQLGDKHPYSMMVETFSKVNSDNLGTIDHVNYIIQVLSATETDLQNTNVILYNAEQQRIELMERIIENVQENLDRLQSEIAELEQQLADNQASLDEIQQSIQETTEEMEQVQQEYEEYMQIHDDHQDEHKCDIKDRLLQIQMIRVMKEDFRNEFHRSRRYLLNSRFHFKI